MAIIAIAEINPAVTIIVESWVFTVVSCVEVGVVIAGGVLVD